MSHGWDVKNQVATMSIMENGKTEVWHRGTSVGNGMNGILFTPENRDEPEALLSTTILMDSKSVAP